MALHEEFTQHLNLPLPHPENELQDDVIRLRDALSGLDIVLNQQFGEIEQKFGQLDALLQSDDVSLDQVQELVAAIKANRTSIQALVSNNATKAELAAETLARNTAIGAVQTSQSDLSAKVRRMRVFQLLNIEI